MFATLYHNLYYIIFFVSTLYVSTYLFSHIQTIRNIISFAALVLCISFGIGLSFGIQYFPMFLLLTYVGAIIVVTLFVVLTFDIRLEYKQKKKYIDEIFYILGLTELFDAFFCLGWNLLGRANVNSSALGETSASSEEKELVFNQCLANFKNSPDVCHEMFSRKMDVSLYGKVIDHTHDLHVISSNLYTNYSFLFICLSIMLSIALMASLTILKQK